MISALLGHRQPATTQRYAHFADSPAREGVEKTSGAIAAALEGNEPAKVVPFAGRSWT